MVLRTPPTTSDHVHGFGYAVECVCSCAVDMVVSHIFFSRRVPYPLLFSQSFFWASYFRNFSSSFFFPFSILRLAFFVHSVCQCMRSLIKTECVRVHVWERVRMALDILVALRCTLYPPTEFFPFPLFGIRVRAVRSYLVACVASFIDFPVQSCFFFLLLCTLAWVVFALNEFSISPSFVIMLPSIISFDIIIIVIAESDDCLKLLCAKFLCALTQRIRSIFNTQQCQQPTAS